MLKDFFFFLLTGDRSSGRHVGRGPFNQSGSLCRNQSSSLECRHRVPRPRRPLPLSDIVRPRPPLQDAAPPFADPSKFRSPRSDRKKFVSPRFQRCRQATSTSLSGLRRRKKSLAESGRARSLQPCSSSLDLPTVRSASAGSLRQKDGGFGCGRRPQTSGAGTRDIVERTLKKEATKAQPKPEQKISSDQQLQRQVLHRLQD